MVITERVTSGGSFQLVWVVEPNWGSAGFVLIFFRSSVFRKTLLLIKKKKSYNVTTFLVSSFHEHQCWKANLKCVKLMLDNQVDGNNRNGVRWCASSGALRQPASTPASIKARILIICDCLQSTKLKIPLEKALQWASNLSGCTQKPSNPYGSVKWGPNLL